MFRFQKPSQPLTPRGREKEQKSTRAKKKKEKKKKTYTRNSNSTTNGFWRRGNVDKKETMKRSPRSVAIKWAAPRQNQENECAPSVDSDQPGPMPRLIWVFAGRTLTLLVLSWRGSNTAAALCHQESSKTLSQKHGHKSRRPVLVNLLGSLPRNSVVRLTDRLVMTIVVDWDVKSQRKQTNKNSDQLPLPLVRWSLMWQFKTARIYRFTNTDKHRRVAADLTCE